MHVLPAVDWVVALAIEIIAGIHFQPSPSRNRNGSSGLRNQGHRRARGRRSTE